MPHSQQGAHHYSHSRQHQIHWHDMPTHVYETCCSLSCLWVPLLICCPTKTRAPDPVEGAPVKRPTLWDGW